MPIVIRATRLTALLRPLHLMVVLHLVSPLPVHAQFGSLAKKAAARVAARTAGTQGVSAESPTFSDAVVELDESRAQALLVGLQAASTATGPGGATRATLLQRSGEANEQRNAILSQHDAEPQRLQDEERKVNMCTGSVLDSLDKAHGAEMEKKARALAASPDPMNSRTMQELMQATMELQKRIAAGDPAGATALQRALARKQGIDPARDSALAASRCGTIKGKARWQLQADSLLALSNSLMRQAQSLDEESARTGAAAAAMTPQQFAIARERVHAFVSANGNPSSRWRFSAAERSALLPRLQQFKAAL